MPIITLSSFFGSLRQLPRCALSLYNPRGVAAEIHLRDTISILKERDQSFPPRFRLQRSFKGCSFAFQQNGDCGPWQEMRVTPHSNLDLGVFTIMLLEERFEDRKSAMYERTIPHNTCRNAEETAAVMREWLRGRGYVLNAGTVAGAQLGLV